MLRARAAASARVGGGGRAERGKGRRAGADSEAMVSDDTVASTRAFLRTWLLFVVVLTTTHSMRQLL